jgi:hypothetical protein
MCGCGGVAPLAPQTDTARGLVGGKPMLFIQHHHLRLKHKGRRMSSGGYVLVFRPNHPRATSAGLVFEHILVAEAALGRPLPASAVVHHVDDDKANNANGNLCILGSNTEHLELHARRRVRRAGGRPFLDWICSRCKAVKARTEFGRRRDGRISSTCRACDSIGRTERKRRAREAA